MFYHHVSGKHSGELIMVARAELPGECPHPTTNIFQSAVSGAGDWAANGAEDLVPDVHCSDFFPDSNREAVARSICFFKDKWWRNDAWYRARFERTKYC